MNGDVIPGPWRCNDNELSSWFDYRPQCSNHYSTEAKAIREEYIYGLFHGRGSSTLDMETVETALFESVCFALITSLKKRVILGGAAFTKV